MRGREWATLLVQTALIVCAIVAAVSLEKWSAVAGTSVLGAGLVALRVALQIPQTRARLPGWVAARGFSLLLWLSLLLTTALWDLSFGVAIFAISAALAVAGRWLPAFGKISWNFVAGLWLGFLAFLWLVTGYIANLPGSFFGGLLSILTLLILCRLSYRMNAIAAQVVNTLILLVAGLPVADLVYGIHHGAEIRPETIANYYSYDKAGGNPNASYRAGQFYWHNFGLAAQKIFEPIPQNLQSNGSLCFRACLDRPSSEQAGYRLRPGSHAVLMECPIYINSNGFRGREIAAEKGNVYRIVAIGESTTFGMTFKATDKPWPEVLEQIIHERLKTRRPVEVINAGVPSYTIWDNLRRFPHQILPVKPDMIISYHGYNGFYMIDSSLMRPVGDPTPDYEERPLKLAADFEYRIKLRLFFHRYRPKISPDKPPDIDPLKTSYADAYRQLIQVAATNRVRLMLANYCMAANERSDPSVAAFYQGGISDSVVWMLQANQAHSKIVEQLTREHRDIGMIDTHPHLDGEHEKFIDIMHFNQDGRRQMAENMFAGIKGILEKDIGQ